MRPRPTSRLAEEAEGGALRPSMRQKAGHEVASAAFAGACAFTDK